MVLKVEGKRKYFDPFLLYLIEQRHNAEALSIVQDVNTSQLFDSTRKTLLHFAAEYGNSYIVQYLIDSGTEPDVQDKLQRTPLMLAVQLYQFHVIAILLQNNADIHVLDSSGRSVAQTIFEGGVAYENIICLLLNKIKSDFAGESEKIARLLLQVKCPLYLAILVDDASVTKIMLDGGCAIDSTHPLKLDSALHIAVNRRHLGNVQLLVERGANVNALNSGGRIPFIRYSFDDSEQELKILEILTNRGSSLSTLDNYGELQIQPILNFGRRKAVRLILRSNVDLHTVGTNNQSVMHLLARNMNLRKCEDIINELRGKHFNVNAQDWYGGTALSEAAAIGNTNFVKFLLENNAEVDAGDKINNTPLVLACWNSTESLKKQYRKCIELLLKHGANPQLVTSRNGTAFDRILPYRNDTAVQRMMMESMMVASNPHSLKYCRGGLYPDDYNSKDPPMNFLLAEALLGQLAIDLDRGSDMNPIALGRINSYPPLKYMFELCREKLEELKTTSINESLTLFQLLSEDEKKLTAYARNEEFSAKLRSFDNAYSSNGYYSNLIRDCLEKPVRRAEWKRKAVGFLSEIMSMYSSSNALVIYHIVDHFNDQDLQTIQEL